MSDLPMTLPCGAEEEPKRMELIFHCAEPRDECTKTLWWLPVFRTTASHGSGHGHNDAKLESTEPFFVREPDWMRFCCAAERREEPDVA
jgi:hypothetical protein